MTDTLQKENFQSKPKMRIVKTILKDKEGNIVGEFKNDNNRHKTR